MIDVIATTRDWVVVDKPSGLLSIPGRGPDKQDCVVSRVREAFPKADGPMMVHRLDMDTSGLMVVALNRESQRTLSRQFEERYVRKTYIGVVATPPLKSKGIVRLRTRLDPDQRPHQVVDDLHGKLGVTHYEVLESVPKACTLLLKPHTGRTHQLRLHTAFGLGCPLLGDVLYGDGRSASRLHLHATALEFSDPTSGVRQAFRSTPPFFASK